MKFATSPSAAFPTAHPRSSLSHQREHTPPSSAQVSAKSEAAEKKPSGRGNGGKHAVDQDRHFTLRPPHIWEDGWAYDLDHHGPSLHIPEPVNEPGRNVVLFEEPAPPKAIPGSGRPLSESPLKRILADINARAISPRQMQELSLDLYVNGILTWDEHAELAFQAELHPDFGRTIGALTGEKPLPDHPRDFVKVWEQRLAFERRFAPAASRAKDRALHILSVLRRIEQPASLLT